MEEIHYLKSVKQYQTWSFVRCFLDSLIAESRFPAGHRLVSCEPLPPTGGVCVFTLVEPCLTTCWIAKAPPTAAKLPHIATTFWRLPKAITNAWKQIIPSLADCRAYTSLDRSTLNQHHNLPWQTGCLPAWLMLYEGTEEGTNFIAIGRSILFWPACVCDSDSVEAYSVNIVIPVPRISLFERWDCFQKPCYDWIVSNWLK